MGTGSLRAGRAPVTMRVPFAASSVAVARQRLRSWLGELDASRDVVEDARLVVSELVANSVRHARPLSDGCIQISWEIEERGLRLAVTDGGGRTRPHSIHASASALAGRGMAIVESLALQWWSERRGARSTVYAVLPLA